MNRRGFLRGILAAGAAPWVCTKAGILMPVRQVAQPDGVLTLDMLNRAKSALDRAAEDDMYLAINPPLFEAMVQVALYGSCRINFAHGVRPLVLAPAHFPRARVRV